MSDYPGSNSNNSMGPNLKEVYSDNKPKKTRFKKIKKAVGYGGQTK